MLREGARLGPYEILSSIGSGGMGEVYRALDSRLGREVAIKVLPSNLARDNEALGRFEKEARTLAALSHPGILTLFDFGNEQGVVYAVMELLAGKTLREHLNEGPVTVARAVEIGIAAAEGLAAAHSRGIIHRDLKPENIFLTADHRVKILDFGLAHWDLPMQTGNLTKLPTGPLNTRTGVVMGTIHYMSPEQVRGIAVDERTDIFSLGIVMYEMVHGLRPFAAQTAAETMVAILKEDPARPSKRDDVPPNLTRIIYTCLEKEPARRFASVTDLCTALKEVASGSAVSIALSPRSGSARVRRKRKIDSIAILPFENAGGPAETEYLCDGITETIINTLSQIPKLRVMARSTVFLYKGKKVDPRELGRDMNVRALLTGRLLHRADDLNVQVELVDTDDGAQLWGEQYTQEICDIQKVQREISESISAALRLKLLGEEKRKLQKRYTESMAAYRLYLQGRFHWNTRTEEGLRKGMELFQRAIEEDPGFALAYAGLADSYSVLGGFYLMPPMEAYPKAEANALQAIKMDPSLAEAYTSLATVKERYDWDWDGAARDFRKAVKLNPGYATGHQWYATFQVMMGRFRQGDAQIEKAMELDPLSVVMNWTRSYLYYYMRQYEKALAQFRRTLGMDPDFHRARFDMAVVYHVMGKRAEALATFEEWSAQRPDQVAMLPLMGYYHAISGRREEALETIRKMETMQVEKYISRFSIAQIHIALGDIESAFQCLEQSVKNHEDPLVSLKVNPRLDPLRSDPRFESILRSVGF